MNVAPCHCERSAAISLRRILAVGLLLATVATATAKYNGGTGEPNDPYQIATAADLIALGETPEDYDKHFILTADIDLNPNLPGRKVFDKAVIAPDVNDTNWNFDGTPFTGAFDGNGHTISHLTVTGGSYLALFGQLGDAYHVGGEVKRLGVLDVTIVGSRGNVGGLVGRTYASECAVTQCYSTGAVSGRSLVGGLIGYNEGSLTQCYDMSAATGTSIVGGLVGENYGYVAYCNSTGRVHGIDRHIGGLVGWNEGILRSSYASASATGDSRVGGLAGTNGYRAVLSNAREFCRVGTISDCYSVSRVAGTVLVGGLLGANEAGEVVESFWDTQTSGQTTSAAGTGKTTVEMRDPNTFMAAGWDFVGEPDGPHDIWAEPIGGGYPVLFWQLPTRSGLPVFSGGTGEPNC